METIEKRFWTKVDKNGPVIRPELGRCWIWIAGTFQNGYGAFYFNNKLKRSHRVAYEFHFGSFDEKLIIRHRCHNKRCIRWLHLEAGTHEDNMRDMTDANRQARHFGEKNGIAKLTSDQVIEIRRLHKETAITQKDIAKQFKVSRASICLIVNNKHWNHIE